MPARRTLIACLGLAALLSAPGALNAQQQSPTQQPVPEISQEYYLLQAYHATTAPDRRSIHHLGLLAEFSGDGYRISAVLDGLPAQQAGLRRGDLLVSVDGQPFDPVLSLNPHPGDGKRGPAVTESRQVALTYARDGSSQTVNLQTVYGNLFDAYRTATANSVQQFASGNKVIGYVKLWTLDRSTDGMQTFRQLIDSLDHCDGLIIDLRDSYGFISAAHLDRFFPTRNSYFQLNGDNPDLWQPHQPERESSDYYGRAMVILQNGGTRGGMELLAYQLGKLQRAVTLGETTMGRAGQVSHDRQSGAIHYLERTDIRIDGNPLESRGVDPEQYTAYPLAESSASDLQLEAGVMALLQIL